MQIETIEAKFRNGAHSYSFSPNGFDLKVGDYVIVDTEKGRDVVRVTKAASMVDVSDLVEPLKDVVKIATAEELKLGQGFPKDYIIDRDYLWHVYPAAERVKRIGNSVVPIMAQKLVEANCSYLKAGERIRNMMIDDGNPQLRFA